MATLESRAESSANKHHRTLNHTQGSLNPQDGNYVGDNKTPVELGPNVKVTPYDHHLNLKQ